MSDLHNLILRYIESGTNVTRNEILKAKLGRWEDVRKAFAELNAAGKIWIISGGTVEVAGKTAKL